MRFIWQHSDKISQLATVLTLVVAVGALLIAVVQIRASNRAQKEATAQEAYREYLKLAMDNPLLANGITPADPTPRQKAAYDWFISYFFHSAEQIFLLFRADREWANVLSDQICIHKTYLSEVAFLENYGEHYEPDFRKFIQESLDGCEN